jgi:hypothetical protein
VPTVPPTTDNGPTNHERVMTLGLAMAAASLTHYSSLSRAGRRELLTAWAEFAQNLAALGVRVQAEES